MAISIDNIKLVMSGGSSNTTIGLSLGGALSTQSNGIITSQLTDATTIAGITINYAASNPVGVGVISWDNVNQRIGWQPPNSSNTVYTSVTTNGTYLIGNAAGYIMVTVVYASLPATVITEYIGVVNKTQNVFADIQPLDSLLGTVKYRCVFIKNTNVEPLLNTTIWWASTPPGGESIFLALDPAGVGNGSTNAAIGPLPDENNSTNLLTSLTWSNPLSYASGLVIGTLTQNSCQAVWMKRVVYINSTTSVYDDFSTLGIAYTG